jgi:hypothetical protein
MTHGLQRAGGIAALVAASAFAFVFALVAASLAPLTAPDLPFGEYLSLQRAQGPLIYAWHFAMYIVFGLCLAVVALALGERLKEASPAAAKIGAALGLMYSGFVILGGLLTIHGDEAVLGLAARDPVGAEALRGTLAVVTLCVDSSDRLLGCLWVGLSGVAALGSKALPRGLAVLSLAIGLPGIAGMAFPSLLALSYAFGVGIIPWSAWLGLVLLRGSPAGRGLVAHFFLSSAAKGL